MTIVRPIFLGTHSAFHNLVEFTTWIYRRHNFTFLIHRWCRSCTWLRSFEILVNPNFQSPDPIGDILTMMWIGLHSWFHSISQSSPGLHFSMSSFSPVSRRHLSWVQWAALVILFLSIASLTTGPGSSQGAVAVPGLHSSPLSTLSNSCLVYTQQLEQVKNNR